jgi:hypothetical protein
VGESLQRHVESSVPGNDLRSGSGDHRSDLSDLGLRALPHVGGLVELPELSFGDLIIGSGEDGLRHVSEGLVISDLLVGELVVDELGVGGEGVEGALAFVVERCCEEHDEGSGVEVANGELGGERNTSLSKR